MTFNPFDKTIQTRLEAVNLLKAAYQAKGFTDSVLPGRTVPNPDELPASIIYLSDSDIKRAMAEDDNSTNFSLEFVIFLEADKYHPEEILDNRGHVIWETFNQVKLTSAKEKLLGRSFEYETDPDTNMCSLTISFYITL